LPSQAELRAQYGDVSRTTVIGALKKLAEDGLISRGQGSPAEVIAVPGQATVVTSPTASVEGDLRASLGEAFKADEITMDVLSLTSETVATYLADPVVLITQREIAPSSIRLRLMLPDVTGIKLAFPRAVTGPGEADEEWPRERHRRMVIRYAEALQHSLLSLRDGGLVENVSVEIRTVPFTPPMKLYLLNGDQLLEGYYTLKTWKPEPPKDKPEITILDSVSVDTTLFQYTKAEQASKVEQAQEFFDAYWDQLSQEADFGQT
jgi:hypothetical protein